MFYPTTKTRKEKKNGDALKATTSSFGKRNKLQWFQLLTDSDIYRNIISGFGIPNMILRLSYQPLLGPVLPVWLIWPTLTADMDDIDSKNHWPIPIPRF